MLLTANRYKLLGTALVCGGLLIYEILSTRLLIVVLGQHVVIFAIAFAMLGMGAATSLMSLSGWPEPSTNKNQILSWIATILGLSYLLTLFLITLLNDQTNSLLANATDIGGLDTLVDTIRRSLFQRMLAYPVYTHTH